MTNTYKRGFRMTFAGMRILARCYGHTCMKAFNDALRYTYRHPLVIIFIVMIYVYGLKCLIDARVERDQSVKNCYRAEQQRDSLEILAGKIYNNQ